VFFFDNHVTDVLPRDPALHTFPPTLGGFELFIGIAIYIYI